jgi:hypothetical protein
LNHRGHGGITGQAFVRFSFVMALCATG